VQKSSNFSRLGDSGLHAIPVAKRAGATVVEVKGSHTVYVSQPSAVATLIEQAARKVKAAA
jgi:hypothetical protein